MISGDSRAEDPFVRLFLSLPPFIKATEVRQSVSPGGISMSKQDCYTADIQGQGK